MIELNNNYWEGRWQDGTTRWDIGYASGPIAAYIDQLTDKNLRILVPGCGNAYEAEYLWKAGFKNVTVLDYAASALTAFGNRVPDFPKNQLICSDFFQHEGQYDLIIEQTFFCAIDPKLRSEYVTKMHSLLAQNGKIAGLLWEDKLNTEHPPFGGSKAEYEGLFSELFAIKTLELAHNSIPERAGRELFVLFEKR